MKLTYELKEIKSSNHADFIDGINLYLHYTIPELRTDSKEIAHWLDICNTRFKDPFYILILLLNKKVIGFAELAYFAEEKFAIVDYVVVEEDFRERGAFGVFLGEIKQFIRKKHPDYNYIVGEVGCHSGKEPSHDDRLLIRALKMMHLGVVKCDYFSPRMTEFENPMRAVLMIYSQNKIKEIKKEQFLYIINAIYYKYYLRWVYEFESEKEKIRYSREVSDLISDLENKVKKKKVIEVNGYHWPDEKSDSDEKLKKFKIIRVLSVSLSLLFAILVSVLFVGTVFWVLRTYFDIKPSTAKSIFSIAIILVLLCWVILKNKTKLFEKVIDKLIDIF